MSHHLSFTVVGALLFVITGCGSATVATAGAGPASAKWVGPQIPSVSGGMVQTTIYYGPWLCSSEWMTRCERKCAAEGHPLMGCIWLADIKGDWQGRFLGFPAASGGRLAITHCCCDYPTVSDAKQRRETWEDARKAFRRQWGSEFGEWPRSTTENWPGHHIHDLLHGGPPVALDNVLPVPPGVHNVINTAYPACYAPGGKWREVGPARPYLD